MPTCTGCRPRRSRASAAREHEARLQRLPWQPPVALADRAAARFAHRQIAISHGLAQYLERTEGFPPGTFTVVHYGIEAGPEPRRRRRRRGCSRSGG
jgi:hypothetical protein